MQRLRPGVVGRALWLATAAATAGCGSAEEREPSQAAGLDAAAAATVTAPPDAPPEPPAYPAEVRSLRLTRSISVRAEPRDDAARLGVVARDIRVGYRGAAVGPGCEGRWIEIEPRGYVCDVYLEPSERRPEGVELPKLRPGELVPGRYGRVVRDGAEVVTAVDGVVTGRAPLAAALTVQHRGDAVFDGVPHWRIGADRYVEAARIRPQEPSAFAGVRLGDETGLDLPIAFAMSGGRPGDWVPVYADPAGERRLERIAPRTPLVPREVVRGADGEPVAYRIADGDEWILAADLRLAEKTAPPTTALPGERWIDVDLDRQILVAYEGDLPVFTTLVSSGTRLDPTETGVYRIWIKFAETDMSGRMGESDAYEVANVPWTQFYAPDLALHTAYWHDRFGQKRSHGCINLSPRDARFLYFFSEPNVPPGWSMANGDASYPGSMVRVRSLEDPDPELRGYAAEVAAARRAGDKSALLLRP